MSNPQNISGPAPKDPLESGKNAPSPEKFKKVMGVERSDESEERGQKNRLRQADEEEGEEGGEIQSDSDLFSKLMSDKQTKQFNLGSSRQVDQQVSQPEEKLKLPETTDTTPLSSNEDNVRLSSKNENFSQDLDLPKTPDSSKTSEETKKSDPFLELKKIEEKMEGLLHPHPKLVHPKDSLEIEPESSASVFNTSDTKSHLKHEKHEAKKPGEKQSQLIQPPTHILEPSAKQTIETPSGPIPIPITETLPAPPMTPAPAYAQFSPHIYELFQKLVGMMTVMQFQGKTTTSIVLNMPNSSLNGAHIDIEHFDTAPHAFNVQIFANPEGQKIFSNNLESLEQQLKLNLPQFDINVKKPLLLDESKEDRRRRLSVVQKQQGKYQ
jgi:hypothetical protein